MALLRSSNRSTGKREMISAWSGRSTTVLRLIGVSRMLRQLDVAVNNGPRGVLLRRSS